MRALKVGVALFVLLATGCGVAPRTGACPMFEGVSGLTVQASPYAAAHRQAGYLWACASRIEAGCAVDTTRSQASATGDPGGLQRFLPGLAAGRWWVRVVIATRTGTRLVDAVVQVTMRSSGIAGCPNTMRVAGSVTVNADGTLHAS